MVKKIGEKIRKRRLELGMTQKEVVTDFMTRNMLSVIESGHAMPSLETAEYLAKALSLPLSYLFADDDTLFFYEKKEKIQTIRNLYENKNYEACIEVINSLSDSDDELRYIYAFCALNLGKSKLFYGALASAATLLAKAEELAALTCYDTSVIEAEAPLYLSVANNIHTPLLEFDTLAYENKHSEICDYEFFKYLTMNFEYEFANESYGKHLKAKQLIKKYAYYEAIAILKELEEDKNNNYNAFLLFGVYSDMEIAFKQVGDFENAYRYASKRLSLISAFQE